MKYSVLVLSIALILSACATQPATQPSAVPIIPSNTAVSTETKAPDMSAPGVYVKKTDSSYSITWVFDEPDAKNVGLAGDFQNWDPLNPKKLTKNAAGLWTLTMAAKRDTIIVYKYYVDGKWYQDPHPPKDENDSMGGRNGKVIVSDFIE